MHDIIDNIEIKLLDHLKAKLSITKNANFAVGWLFLSGFKALRDEIENIEKLKILVGSRTNKETAEAILLGKKWEEAVKDTLEKNRFLPEDKIKELLDIEFKELLNDLSYIKASVENIEFLKWFIEKLKEGKIEIRIYYKEPLHSKLYIFEYKDKAYGLGEAIVGSSNFSISGFNLNTELNVRVLGDENLKKLSKWFEERWEESKKADFTELAKEAIEKSWAFGRDANPFRIYLRVLHEIFAYKEEEHSIEIQKDLFRFQEDAVIDAYRRLKKYNGVFISDVPGLGKTYIGAALLSHLESEGKASIVISPPRLIEWWEEVLSDFGCSKAKVFSSGNLEEILNNEKYLKRKVVLIDESHHFRNPDTQKYNNILKICEGKEVILLSATPQNLSIMDIYHQIKLFTPYEKNHYFRIYPIELKEYFKKCERGEANIEDLIAQIFIRRTRSDIREFYPDERLEFPKRIGPYRVDYSIDEVYEGGLYERINELIKKLTFSRYNLGNYAKVEKFDADQLQRLKNAWQNLQKLVQINIYRRLESSVQAFKDTISNHLDTHKGFLKILNEQKKVLIGEANEIKSILEDMESGYDFELEEENYFPEEFFYSDELKKDLENDIKIFEEMNKAIKDIKPEDDDKLQKLIEILSKTPIKDKKVLIFSCFESTVKYIYENIKNPFKSVDFLVGGEKFATKVKRFAPKANNFKINPQDEIEILVATEVLSEGVNLQDSQVVINYELHWNPVRIIQRIGRIDRIGTENKEIYVFNFFPEVKAEKEINVEKKVQKRIDEIIQNLGYDEKTISLDEKTVRKKLFEIYTEKEESLEEEEEKSSAKYFEMEFKKLIKEFPEEYEIAKGLPAMINIGREDKEKGIIAFCKADDYFRLRYYDFNGQIISGDDWEILKILKADPNEKGKTFNYDKIWIIERIKEEFENEANKREKDKEITIDPLKNSFKKLIEWFKRKESKEIKKRFDELFRFVEEKELGFENQKFLRNIIRSYPKKFGLKKEEILKDLEEKIYNKLKYEKEIKKPEIKRRYAQIIIFEELS